MKILNKDTVRKYLNRGEFLKSSSGFTAVSPLVSPDVSVCKVLESFTVSLVS